MPKPQLTEQEWSHFFDVSDMEKSRPTELKIEASEEERVDLARRFSVKSLLKAEATLSLSRESGIVHVTGQFDCVMMQNCVVEMEPFEITLSEPVEGWFVDKDSTVSFAAAKKERDVVKSHAEVEILAEKEDPEPILEGCIDLGELVAQHISLSIPQYPHKEGVAYEVGDEDMQLDDKSPLRKNPFEALKDWKEKR